MELKYQLTTEKYELINGNYELQWTERGEVDKGYKDNCVNSMPFFVRAGGKEESIKLSKNSFKMISTSPEGDFRTVRTFVAM